jgi:polysaccharide export outer membrane protein
MKPYLLAGVALGVTLTAAGRASAQSTATAVGSGATTAAVSDKETTAVVPGYVIGPDDVLTVVFWREKELSGDVIVRPDGRISLPLINDVEAVGLTPEELRARLTELSSRYVQDPNVTVVVKQINSRKVFVTGMVAKPGPVSLTSSTTVLQLIAMVGGVQEYARKNKIVVVRTENGKQVRYPFNYDQVLEGRNLNQNIELKPGDTVIVP